MAEYSPSYRPDVDGLRGIAVISVIGFHAFPDWVRGGYVGVDIFFVISGYLISTLIVGGLEGDRFTFSGFYARRIKRIFPALILLLAVCYGWGWFFLFPDDYQLFGKHMAGSAGFVANFTLWGDTWYFDPASDRKPLLHLWSLGIEEQFYLVWPLLLYAAWKRRLNLLWPTGLILIASYLTSAYEIRRDALAAFYSPLTRVWELALGAALAVGAPDSSLSWGRHWRRARDWASLAGVALIAISVFSVGQEKLLLGLRAALPTAGAVLLIGAGPGAWLNRILLSRRSLVGVGLISYPLYLWHWPLLSFTAIVRSRTPSLGVRVAVIATSALLAWLTYRLIERPIRASRTATATVPVLCSLLAVILCIGEVTYWKDGLPGRHLHLSDQGRFVQYYESLRSHGLGPAYWDACDFLDWTTRNTRPALDPECTRRGVRGTVLLWGDSYAQALSLGIRHLLPPEIRLAQIATSACAPSNMELDATERCLRSNRRALAAIRELTPDVVVLAQSGNHESTDWEALSAQIRALGAKRILLMGPTPKWRPSLPLVVTSQYWGRGYGRVKSGLDPEVFKVDAALKKRFERETKLEYTSMVDRLCNAEGCLATVPGGGQDLIAVDSGHLSPRGSIFVVDQVLGHVLVP